MESITLVPSSLSAEQFNATYSCIWLANTHPVLSETFAPSTHWSSPILVTHRQDYDLWPGRVASPGMELVAETGATNELLQEIKQAQASDLVGAFAIGTDLPLNTNTALDDEAQKFVFNDLVLTPEFSLLSSVSRMLPSQDTHWFTGMFGFSPIDQLDGVWYEVFEVATYLWDAGTKLEDTENAVA